MLRAEFNCPCPRGLSINTNNILNPSDLTTMERYLKSIKGANNNEILAPQLPQSKSYLKITSIPYIQSNGNKLTGDDIMNVVILLENFLQKCSMGYILYLWISLLEPTLETFYRPQI